MPTGGEDRKTGCDQEHKEGKYADKQQTSLTNGRQL